MHLIMWRMPHGIIDESFIEFCQSSKKLCAMLKVFVYFLEENASILTLTFGIKIHPIMWRIPHRIIVESFKEFCQGSKKLCAMLKILFTL